MLAGWAGGRVASASEQPRGGALCGTEGCCTRVPTIGTTSNWPIDPGICFIRPQWYNIFSQLSQLSFMQYMGLCVYGSPISFVMIGRIHVMMTSSNGDIFRVTSYWPFGREIHRAPVNSPHKGQWRQWTQNFDVTIDLRWDKWFFDMRLNKQSRCWWFDTP